VTPLAAARDTDLGRFAGWADPERIVGNLHRACAELAGTPRGVPATCQPRWPTWWPTTAGAAHLPGVAYCCPPRPTTAARDCRLRPVTAACYALRLAATRWPVFTV